MTYEQNSLDNFGVLSTWKSQHFKPGILGGRGRGTDGVNTPPAPSFEKCLPIGGIIVVWDGHQFGEYNNRDECLEKIKQRDWMSNSAGDFDCLEFYEVVDQPQYPLKGSLSGAYDTNGRRVVFGYAVQPIENLVTDEIRQAKP